MRELERRLFGKVPLTYEVDHSRDNWKPLFHNQFHDGPVGGDDGVRRLLDGIRVIEMGAYVFGPGAGALLADWGADVLKVEHPVAGDPSRGVVTASALYEHVNRGKRSVGIDVATVDAYAGRRALALALDINAAIATHAQRVLSS